MRVAVSGLTALRALRVYRRSGAAPPSSRERVPRPDPSPRHRWRAGLLPLERLALDEPPSAERSVELVCGRAGERVQARFARCSVHPSRLPAESFSDLGDGLFVPCPELLFLQLARVMAIEVLALLGYELCGTYARDPRDPRCGPIVYDVPPVTSTERIATYLDSCGEHAGVAECRLALSRVRDGAWSPMEAVVAQLLVTSAFDLGYGVGDIALNVRHGATPELVALGARESRVPDIEVAGSRVGFNYDGRGHLDLESIAEAAAAGDATERVRAVREKNYDDIKRDRELVAGGHVVMPMVSQDLFGPGALDLVMLQAGHAMQELDGHGLADMRVVVDGSLLSARRQALVWALLPWRRGAEYLRLHLGWRPWESDRWRAEAARLSVPFLERR